MLNTKYSLASAAVVVISCIFYSKFARYIPDPEKGVLYYYQCNDFESQRVFNVSKENGLYLDPENELFVIIPGYTETPFRKWVTATTEALLKVKSKSCVLMVNHWNLLTFSRPFMTENVKKIAQDIAELLLALDARSYMRFDNIHLIGFSLGGWVSGLVSNYLPEGKKIKRITGIDASFPWQETNDTQQFLDSNDAEIVVLIRTSKLGLKSPPVHYDFLVNGGRLQPACDVWWHPDFVQQICSHYTAPALFITHLVEEEPAFVACRCPSRESLLKKLCPCNVKNSFGLNLQTGEKGNFYMETPGSVQGSS